MIKLNTHIKTILADTKTPTGLFMSLRDLYQKPLLLESSDYNNKQNHYSYLCFNPLASFEVFNKKLKITIREESTIQNLQPSDKTLIQKLIKFKEQFLYDESEFNFCTAGIFGYSSFNSIEYFENLVLKEKPGNDLIPDLLYHVYSLILVFNHSTNSLHLISHAETEHESVQQMHKLIMNINTQQITEFSFTSVGIEHSNQSDEQFINLVNKSKEHCRLGDVFQIVMSRQFSQDFKGDDFNLYRALKNINPSPYLFYFDTGKFRLIGSSPEAQVIISNSKVQINPIAGTYRRTGNDLEDFENAGKLLNDEKETAEHMMLVDLARNDLSKFCNNVIPKYLKQVQYYSHVIHLVSKIEGDLKENVHPYTVLANSSPAGTLSGAPKYKALQLIDENEPTSRGFYGGSIGFISNKNELNHAIMIRTFLSKNSKLYYQAGAGIVDASNAESEKNEINHKINALKKAIKEAEKINKTISSYSHETISA